MVEVLVVIVVLGVLSAIVVFSVRGSSEDAREAACANDRAALIRQVEAYYAREGVYAGEAEMVNSGLLRGESELFDVVVAPDGSSFSLTALGDCA